MNKAKIRLALEQSFYCHDLERRVTVRQYLQKLLLALWIEGEGFSGKRPFGNGGWQRELAVPLVAGKFIRGKLHEDPEERDGVGRGYADGYSAEAYDKAVIQLIKAL